MNKKKFIKEKPVNIELRFSHPVDLAKRNFPSFNDDEDSYKEFIKRQNEKQHDAFILTLTIALRMHLGRDPEISDFKKCRLIYSDVLPSEPQEFTYQGKTLVKFEHSSGLVNNKGEVTYKHETKVITL